MLTQRTTYLLLLFFALMHSVSSCVWSDTTSPPVKRRIVKDDLGREVRLPEKLDRLISLAPNITEFLFALNLGDRVVGVTSYCDYPAEARGKEKVGDTVRPSLERIIALKPDLVVASRVSQLEVFKNQLNAANISVYVVDAKTLSDVSRSLRQLGLLFDRREQGDALAAQLEQRVRHVTSRIRSSRAPGVLLVIQQNPLMVPGTKSYLADLVNNAGGVLIGPDDFREGITYSFETVIAQQPEYIILPGPGGTPPHRLDGFAWPTLKQTPAMRAKRVFSIDADLLMRPGPRLIDGLEQLAQVLNSRGDER
jgi:iron complex transport system substrate-binding protein